MVQCAPWFNPQYHTYTCTKKCKASFYRRKSKHRKLRNFCKIILQVVESKYKPKHSDTRAYAINHCSKVPSTDVNKTEKSTVLLKHALLVVASDMRKRVVSIK